jgi:hypothetical protein
VLKKDSKKVINAGDRLFLCYKRWALTENAYELFPIAETTVVKVAPKRATLGTGHVVLREDGKVFGDNKHERRSFAGAFYPTAELEERWDRYKQEQEEKQRLLEAQTELRKYAEKISGWRNLTAAKIYACRDALKKILDD